MDEEAEMAFKADKIWVDGEMVDWDKAQIHILSHVVHYGTSAFEGLRCYKTSRGSVVMRLEEHIKRLYDSCKIYRMEIPYEQKVLEEAVLETLRVNKLEEAYIRPFVFRGFGALGVNPLNCPMHVAVAAWEWGKYLGPEALENGVNVCVSSWNRAAPNTFPTLAKVGANYMNSQLIKMEALRDGYDEGIALDTSGFISEGSGENIFVVVNGSIYTPPSSSSILPGITRHCMFQLARDMGIVIKQHQLPREILYTADEVFMTGTAAEITPVTKVDNITVGTGKRGPVAKALQEKYFGVINGELEDKHGWLTQL